MNNTIMRSIDVTADWAPLAAERLVGSVTISTPPTNAEDILFLGDDGGEVPWVPGEWHEFRGVNLAEIRVKGQIGDRVTIVGGTW